MITNSGIRYGAKKKFAAGVRLLAKNKLIIQLAKKSPKAVFFAKKISRVIFGSVPSYDKQGLISEKSLRDFINPDMTINYAEHNILIHDNKTYWYDRESKGHYDRHVDDPRIVAIYLPQFHPFKENDEAWGKGFTEWTNVTTSNPRFVGQQQPVLPSDLGFYDLRLPETIKQQIDLAKKYGIYGFQFYYYWFSGKKVMDLPLNTILNNPAWNFHFSICWANENWTRKWDGGSSEVIFEQKNKPDDPINFIKDVAPILNDTRYIHENGRPVLTIYRVELLEDPKRYVDIWRNYFKDNFNKDLWLVGHSYSKNVDPVDFGFDATMDFTPIDSLQPDLKPWIDDRKYLTEEFIRNHKLIDMQWKGQIIDFRFIARQEIYNLKNNKCLYKTISPSWSNEARRKGNGGYTFYNSSPEIFVNWLDRILEYEIKIKNNKSPIVFLNAWNEWAEAAMLEPSMHMGHNSLLRVAETISKHSKKKNNSRTFPFYGMIYSKDSDLAVIIHLYYPEMWEKFRVKLKNINVPFDLFISIPKEFETIEINNVSEYHKKTNKVVVPNRGRDVLPFFMIVNRIKKLDNYKYILKLHTKKSLHITDGSAWLDDLLDCLVPVNISGLIKTLAKKNTGIIGAHGHLVSLERHIGGNEAKIVELLKNNIGIEASKYIFNKSRYPYFASTMFWCRVDFLEPLLDAYFMPSDFDSEKGQIDGTTAHAIERILGKILHETTGTVMYDVDSNGRVNKVDDGDFKEKYKFAP